VGCAAEEQLPMGQAALAGLSVEHHHLRQVIARSQKIHEQRKRSARIQRARTIACATVTIALFVAGGILWAFDRRHRKHQQIWNVPLFTWLFVGAVIYPLLCFVTIAVWLSTWLLEVALDQVFENVHYVLISLRTGLKCALFRDCNECNKSVAMFICFSAAIKAIIYVSFSDR
jgi:hypothetical protein